MIPHLIVPGWAGSGPSHWQTAWEAALRAPRVELDDWQDPRRSSWVQALDRALGRLAESDSTPPVLVAHSLGCITIAHWACESYRPVRGAFLVAPADVEHAARLRKLEGFAPLPRKALPFPSLVVTSDDDPLVSIDRAHEMAATWGSEVHVVAGIGHINADSNLGGWDQGRALLARLHQRE